MVEQDRELAALDNALWKESLGLDVQAVGWTMLCFCGIICVFVFVGLRSGSWFWFFCSGGLGFLGLLLAGGGALIQTSAEADFEAAGEVIHRQVLSELSDEEQRRQDGGGPRAA